MHMIFERNATCCESVLGNRNNEIVQKNEKLRLER